MIDDDTLTRRRAARALQRSRRRRRRRLGAVGALLVVIAATVAAIAGLGGGGGSRPRRAAARSARRSRTDRGGVSRASSGTAAALGPPTGRPGHAHAPILMYHVIAPPPPGAPFPGLYVPAAQFASQMRALRAAGFRAVTLDQLRANWRDGARLPAGKPVVVSFDNGYRSQYTAALPVLRALHWVGDENIQLTGLPPAQGGLTDTQVRGLVQAGWELDTQGISHADLTALDASALRHQIDDARATLRRRYGVAVDWFCYPSGHYDPAVVAAVRADGFVGSTTVVPGWASRSEDPYRLPRLRVLGGTSPQALLAQIAAVRGAGPAPVGYGVG